LGAGVQSTTMALMAAHGEITPMPTICHHLLGNNFKPPYARERRNDRP
jgi:hypothetical protein